MTKQEKAFVKDLASLLKKHSAKLASYEDYGDEGNYCGNRYTVSTHQKGLYLDLEEIIEALEKIKPNT